MTGGSGNVIAGDDLLPQKARLLLMLSLAFAPDDVEQVREWVSTIGNPQFDTLDPSPGTPPGQAKAKVEG